MQLLSVVDNHLQLLEEMLGILQRRPVGPEVRIRDEIGHQAGIPERIVAKSGRAHVGVVGGPRRGEGQMSVMGGQDRDPGAGNDGLSDKECDPRDCPASKATARRLARNDARSTSASTTSPADGRA